MIDVDAPNTVEMVYSSRPSSTVWLGRGERPEPSLSLSYGPSSKSDSA